MPWFKVDDQWARHDKVRRASKDARTLWLMAGVEAAAKKTDGHVAAHHLKDSAYLADLRNARAAAASLVDVGLWHDSATVRSCPRCKRIAGEIPEGAFYFHDWADYQPLKDDRSTPLATLRDRRKKQLHRDRGLIEKILERDGTQCRYCRVRVDWSDRRGRAGGTYDHVDPDGDNALDNVVVACRRCNELKSDRTPDEAGMPLLDPPDFGTARDA